LVRSQHVSGCFCHLCNVLSKNYVKLQVSSLVHGTEIKSLGLGQLNNSTVHSSKTTIILHEKGKMVRTGIKRPQRHFIQLQKIQKAPKIPRKGPYLHFVWDIVKCKGSCDLHCIATMASVFLVGCLQTRYAANSKTDINIC
jgi:hypothetical protein